MRFIAMFITAVCGFFFLINSLLKRLEQILNKRNRIKKDRTEITQAERNLKHHRHNVTEIGATE